MPQRTLITIHSEDIQTGFYGFQAGEDAQKPLSPFINSEYINTLFLR